MSHWLHPAAEAELMDAAVYYAEHASRRIANVFLTEFERVTALLEQNQQLGTPTDSGLRVHPLRRSPFSVLCREVPDGPQVYAVSHHRREPGYWQERL